MTAYSLKFGREKLTISLPSLWHTQVLKHTEPPPVPAGEALARALSNPVGERPFGEWIKTFRKILIIVPDVTRYGGMEKILPLLYEGYLKDRDVRIIFALGNHRKQTDEEREGLVSPSLFSRLACFDHDCYDEEGLTFVGATSSGLDVVLNKALFEVDGAVVTGSINFHYLAGFGGGRKSIFPGIAGYQTILGIHGKVFNRDKPGKHQSARSGVLRGNPMHEEIMEGIALIRTPLFLINTVLDDRKDFLALFAGNIAAAHEEGCRWYRERFSVPVREKADVVIVSSGGFPKDINFIQAHKGLEHAMGAVKENGTIIVAGECRDGLGNDDFLKWFQYGTSREMEPYVRAADKVYAQTAYATRCKAERCTIFFVSTLDQGQVTPMGLTPVASMEEAIRKADDGREKLCYIIPDGSNTLVYPQTENP